MSDKWEVKFVMSTHDGPVVTLSLGEVLARKDAEIEKLREEIARLRAEVERLRQPTPKRPILGQEAIAGRDGLGRVTEIGPHNPVTDQPEWIGVTPYAGRTWQMNYAPHNVSLVHIRVETNL